MKMGNKWILALASLMLAFNTTVVSAMDAETAGKIEFVDFDGKVTKLSDYKGKWVIVNLWATWCPPCLVEIPELIQFHEDRKDKDAIVLGVNYESNDIKKIKAFSESQMISFPVVRFTETIDGKTSPFGRLKGLPSTYMVTPEGKVVAARAGMVEQKMLEEFMEKYSSN